MYAQFLQSQTPQQTPATTTTDRPPRALEAYFSPFSASHGEGKSPLVPEATAQTLAAAHFAPYRWLTSDHALSGRICRALVEMATMLNKPSYYEDWAQKHFQTLTPIEWSLYTTGSRQAALELVTTIMMRDRPLHSLLLFARAPAADAYYLQEYASGTATSAALPPLPRSSAHATAPASSTPKQPGSRNQRKVTGGGSPAPPDLSALNALVRA